MDSPVDLTAIDVVTSPLNLLLQMQEIEQKIMTNIAVQRFRVTNQINTTYAQMKAQQEEYAFQFSLATKNHAA